MTSRPILRFAPSPNGYLHLGHAYSALFTWRAAAQCGGVALLRSEDIDTGRCKPEFVAAIFADLAWLGLSWPEPVWRQSQRFPVYAAAAERLKAQGLLYPCFCTRTEIAAKAEGPDPDGAPYYPGTCRHIPPAIAAARLAAGEPAQWRLDMDAALARIGERLGFPAPEGWEPVFPELWGDVVIVRKDTPTSYHLSVVVDDAAQGVTLVTRGMDLFAATAVHVVLQRLLDLDTPVYWHHELVLDEGEQKLAKSRGSQSLKSLREAGWSPEDVRRRLGFD